MDSLLVSNNKSTKGKRVKIPVGKVVDDVRPEDSCSQRGAELNEIGNFMRQSADVVRALAGTDHHSTTSKRSHKRPPSGPSREEVITCVEQNAKQIQKIVESIRLLEVKINHTIKSDQQIQTIAKKGEQTIEQYRKELKKVLEKQLLYATTDQLNTQIEQILETLENTIPKSLNENPPHKFQKESMYPYILFVCAILFYLVGSLSATRAPRRMFIS